MSMTPVWLEKRPLTEQVSLEQHCELRSDEYQQQHQLCQNSRAINDIYQQRDRLLLANSRAA